MTSAGCPSACRSRPVWPTALAAEGGLLQAVTVLTVSHPPSRVCSPVYREGFYVALSNLPGNIFTILLMGSIGGKILLCESDGCRNDLASVEYTVVGYFLKLSRTGCVQAFTRFFVVSAAGSLVVSSLSIFLIYVVQTKAQSLLLSCIFSGVSVICWNSLDVLGTELYPTQLRYISPAVAR